MRLISHGAKARQRDRAITTQGMGNMVRIIGFLLSALLTLSACATEPTQATVGADGKPLPKLYRIRPGDASRVQFSMLDGINALREAAGQPPVSMDAALNAAAATHSRDMSVQNRAWHFGSDGSSPIDRVTRLGYGGALIGETISETYETELETLSVWMAREDTRAILMDAQADQMGFSWYQEPSGKIWWTLVTGRSQELTDSERLEDILGTAADG